MIKIKKPKAIPEKLKKTGKAETKKNKKLYEQFSDEFESGTRKFEFDKNIYGHKSVKEILIKAQHSKCCFCERKEEIGDKDLFSAAFREAKEETGLESIQPCSYDIFDIDIHLVPENPKEKAHLHYDIRFLFQADHLESLKITSESRELKWFSIKEIRQLTSEYSILKMLNKSAPG